MVSDLSQTVDEYNQLVSEWNDRYGSRCTAMKIDERDICHSRLKRLRKLFSDKCSEKKKVSITTTVVGDFKNIGHHRKGTDGLSRGELAYLIVQKGEEILSKI